MQVRAREDTMELMSSLEDYFVENEVHTRGCRSGWGMSVWLLQWKGNLAA